MNHLVSRADVDEEQPSLRASQAAATRRRIVDGLLALLAEDHPATLSVPAVARRAGVSVATVYRYFPTKEALLDAGSEVTDQLIEQSGGPATGSTGSRPSCSASAPPSWRGRRWCRPRSPRRSDVRSGAGGCLVAWSCSGPTIAKEGIDPASPEGERLHPLGGDVHLVGDHPRPHGAPGPQPRGGGRRPGVGRRLPRPNDPTRARAPNHTRLARAELRPPPGAANPPNARSTGDTDTDDLPADHTTRGTR